MQHVAMLILGLALCGPLLVQTKKVVLVVPRHLRRSHQSLYHQGRPAHGRKSFHGGKKFIRNLNSGPFHPGKAPFPHGGDDFDQEIQHVNDVHIPHGPNIRYGISFGKGYIPHEEVAGLLQTGPDHEKFNLETESSELQNFEHHEDFEMKPALPNFPSGYSDYEPSGPYAADSADKYLPDQDEADGFEIQERSKGGFEKMSHSKLPHNFANGLLTKEAVSSQVHQAHGFPGSQKARGPFAPSRPETSPKEDASAQASVNAPSSVLLNGGKGGFVITDSLSLDNYNAKVQALTKNWPAATNFASFGNVAGSGSFVPINPLVGHTNQFNSGLPGTNLQTTSTWLKMVPHQGKGYAVKEDMVEGPRQDFRLMPLQRTPIQPQPNPPNFGLPSFPQVLNG